MNAEETDDASSAAPQRISKAAPAAAETLAAGARLAVAYPHRDAIVVTVRGDVDAAGIERVKEGLWPRLSAAVELVVLDLTEVGFLGVPGLQLLTKAHIKAQTRGVQLRLVATGHEIPHVLRMAALEPVLACYGSLTEALAAPTPEAAR